MRYRFFFNDTATTVIYPLSLHDALPISAAAISRRAAGADEPWPVLVVYGADPAAAAALCRQVRALPVTGHCYLLATCPAPTPAALVPLVEAGADDVLPHPPEPGTPDPRLAEH